MTSPETPHAAAAERSGTFALAIGLVFAMLGILLWNEAQNNFTAEWGANVQIPPMVGYLAASLLVAAAGLLSAGLVVHGRLRATLAPLPAEETKSADAPDAEITESRLSLAPDWIAGWPQIVVAVLLGAFALAAVVGAWTSDVPQSLSPQAQQVLGGILILLAFPFVVLERVYANASPQIMPDAPQLARLLRVPLLTFAGLGITSVLLSVGFEWPSLIARALALVIGLVALELVLRGLAMLFVPFAPIATRHSVADSTVASFIRLTPPNPSAVGAAVKRQFGIDLSRSWALAFIRRSIVPITLGMVGFAWCLTGVTALGLNERAVYERLGAPVAVFGPGLHLHLPWPLGIMRRVELGVVHEIPIVFASASEQAANDVPIAQISPPAGIEDAAPASADRLWDTSHPAEASYLIASESQGKQSFQIVNVDLRVVYRIGVTDEAARDAAYAIAEPEALIRAMAGQLLVRYFARYSLLDVLGQSRERFANDFRTELQDRLGALSTGIDVIAVIVEAIHPPPGAAGAYHAVQAAEIAAKSQIALRRADAISALNSAEQEATEAHNHATAAAAVAISQAQAESVLFSGDRQAYHNDGQVFLFERWLDRLTGSLPKSSFILLDHRLKGAAAPTIDFRRFDLPGAAFRPSPPAAAPTTAPNRPRASPSPPPPTMEDNPDAS